MNIWKEKGGTNWNEIAGMGRTRNMDKPDGCMYLSGHPYLERWVGFGDREHFQKAIEALPGVLTTVDTETSIGRHVRIDWQIGTSYGIDNFRLYPGHMVMQQTLWGIKPGFVPLALPTSIFIDEQTGEKHWLGDKRCTEIYDRGFQAGDVYRPPRGTVMVPTEWDELWGIEPDGNVWILPKLNLPLTQRQKVTPSVNEKAHLSREVTFVMSPNPGPHFEIQPSKQPSYSVRHGGICQISGTTQDLEVLPNGTTKYVKKK